jgi:hypothetical protein
MCLLCLQNSFCQFGDGNAQQGKKDDGYERYVSKGWTVWGSNPDGGILYLSRPAVRATQIPVQRVPGLSKG